MIKRTKIIKRDIITPEDQYEHNLNWGITATDLHRDEPMRNVVLDGILDLHVDPFWRIYDFNIRKEVVRSNAAVFDYYEEDNQRVTLDRAIAIRENRKKRLASQTQGILRTLEKAESYKKTIEGKWFKTKERAIIDEEITDQQKEYNDAVLMEARYHCMTYSPKKIAFDTIEMLWHLDVYFYEV